ncbi:MAG: GspE/PulE family protein [Pseudomonadota bacterium]
MTQALDQIGEALSERDLLEADDWRRAQALAEESDQSIRVVLDRLGLLAQEDWAKTAATVLNLKFIELEKHNDALIVHDKLTLEFQQSHKIAVIAENEDRLALAMADPTDDYARRAVELAVGKSVLPCAAVERTIEARLRDHEAAQAVSDDAFFAEEDVNRIKSRADDAPVIRYVDDLIAGALKAGASDIHIEPYEKRTVARMRVDGVLEETAPPPPGMSEAIVSRVKILAGLNIAEHRLPQDGRIRLRIDGKETDLRIATSPCLHGESVVMRVLARDQKAPQFDALGFDGGALKTLQKILKSPHGMIAVTGPTGSGKTTTLYAALNQLNDGTRKILTVEDPVEYQVNGVVQIPVRADIGRTFANSLRSILRQDPDIVMVGEMRDGETAQIAAQAALTGHLVLSTLHTNDAPSAVTRLRDMGLAPYLIAATLRAVVAQRLVRKLCMHCRTPREVPAIAPDIIKASGATQFYEPAGCDACNGRGFSGRVGVFEILPIKEEITQHLTDGADAALIRKIAEAAGMKSLHEDALLRAALGQTTLEEALSVGASV